MNGVRVVYTGTRQPKTVPDSLEVRHAPLLTVESIGVDLERLEHLADEPVGLVLFSKNALRSLLEQGADEALTPLDRHAWWAVGAKTAALTRRELGVQVRVPDDQCFEGLARRLEEVDLPQTLVAFTLEGKPRDLSPALDAPDATYYQMPVYRTRPVDYETPAEVVGDADWLAVTSPKGVAVLERSARDGLAASEIPGEVRVAAIGPNTAAAARDAGLEVDVVPDEPGIEELLDAIAARSSVGSH